MDVYLYRLWNMLTGLFAAIVQAGWVGVAIAIAVGIGVYSWGAGQTGVAARVTGRVMNGQLIDGQYHPEVPGTARTFVGRFTGSVAKLIGLVLTFEGMFALVAVLMASK